MKKRMWKWKVVFTLLLCMAAVGGNWSGCKVQAKEYSDIYSDAETGLEYVIVDNEEIMITGYIGNSTDIVIPDKISGLTVTNIGAGAFGFCSELTSIEIPDSVTRIGAGAFRFCSGLTSIEIPKGVTSIENDAFFCCRGLTSIEIPKGVTSIEDDVFDCCSGLTSIEIPEGVTNIGYRAFEGCDGLTSIEIPSTVTDIVRCAFAECSSLVQIKVNEENKIYTSRDQSGNECNAIMTIDRTELLYGCKTTKILPSITSIGDSAFSGCRGLTSIEIPESVTSIGYGAFRCCIRLTSIEIPKSVTSIEDDAFYGSGLTSIEIPASVRSIGDHLFDDCSSLVQIKVDEENKTYTSQDQSGNECNAIMTIDRTKLLYGCGKTKIPPSITSIGDRAFDSCRGLTSIEIPEGVTSIGNSAFYCSGLMSIIIPESVTSIGLGAFTSCSKNLIIHTLNPYVENYAKENNIKVDNDMNPQPNIPEETVPTTPSTENPTPTTPGGDQGTTPDPPPTTPGGAQDTPPATPSPENPIPTTPGGTAQDTTQNTTPTTEAPVQTSVPAAKGTVLTAEKEKARVKVTSDDAENPTVEYAASTNKSAKTVKVPDTVTVDGVTYKVTSVKDQAFKGNKRLISVTIGKNVASIGKDAFKNCTSLKFVTIQSSDLTKIGSGAFSGNKKLTKITIKTTKLTKNSIGKNALKGTNKKLVIKVPKQQVKNYKKYFKGKGNASVKVTK